jgi:LacI family gluconate utilization system Gnt-I transcriptional repressor
MEAHASLARNRPPIPLDIKLAKPQSIGQRQPRAGLSEVAKITDVAAAAGVAPMTVSRVLNTPSRVSVTTRLRVQEAIDRLGYVPNLIAGGLSSRRSRVVAAIVPTIASPMFNEPLQAFTDSLDQAGYRVMLALSGYRPDAEDALIRAVLTRRPDGLLLTGADHSPAVRRLLRDAAIPVVEIWDAAEEPTDMLVGFDHAEVGGAVADFFIAAGHTRFAVLAAGDARAGARRDGFSRRVEARGFSVTDPGKLPSPSLIRDGRQALAAIAGGLQGRTALFCSSDLIAFGALTEARVLGIDVPGRLAICGFGDFEISRSSEPAFSTVSVDGLAMGRVAAEHLLARMLHPNAEVPASRVIVPFRIMARAST